MPLCPARRFRFQYDIVEEIEGVNIGNFNPVTNKMSFVNIGEVRWYQPGVALGLRNSCASLTSLFPSPPPCALSPCPSRKQRFLREGMRVRALECREYCSAKVCRAACAPVPAALCPC